MQNLINRRKVLANSAFGLAAYSFLPFLSAASQVSNLKLTDSIQVLTGLGGNILVHSSNDGLVLVDSGSSNNSAALMENLSIISKAGVKTLFNTHWHLDQIGGNELLGSKGAEIIAHKKTNQHLSIDYYLPDEDRYEKALSKEGHPTQAFHATASLSFAGENIEYGYLRQAHTDGDIYVHFQEANVLAVGDVVSPLKDPELDWFGGGWIGGRVDALDLILSMSDEDTIIVPSYGSAVEREVVLEERDLMQHLYKEMVDLIREGYSARDIYEDGLMDNLPRQFNDPYKFLYDAHKGLWAHHNKLEPNIV